MIVVSLASYDKRITYLQRTIDCILKQTLRFDNLIINIPSETDGMILSQFKDLEKLDSRIIVRAREGNWRSANKLIFSLKEYSDCPIITCDDDIMYPSDFFQCLYDKWSENKDCIIAHEISPVFIVDNKIQHISCVDTKLLQKTFGRYLTGCCLFPPHVFDNTDVFDFEKYMKVTNGTHDELWFWCQTTLNNVRSIGLNCTYSFDSDQLTLPRDENSLSRINTDPYLKSYNEKINEVYGDKLVPILQTQVCDFYLDKNNFLGFVSSIGNIYNIYGKYYKIRIMCDKSILKSHLAILSRQINRFNWEHKMEIKLNG